MMHIVYGTRAELIKFSYFIKELKRRNIEFKLVDTGQHDTRYLTKILKLPDPDYFLGESLRKFWIKQRYHFISSLIALFWGFFVFLKLRKIFRREGEIIIFHGNAMSVPLSVFAAKFARKFLLLSFISIIALSIKILIAKTFGRNFNFKLMLSSDSNLTLIHFESGLRGNTKESFLIDAFYKIGDHNADILFVPAKSCQSNLERELVDGKIIFTKDSFFDVIKFVQKIKPKIEAPKVDYILLTLTVSLTNKEKAKILSDVLSKSPFKVILAINKRMREKLVKYGVLEEIKNNYNVKIISPINYTAFQELEKNSIAVVTDSNGVQEECNFFKKPCIVLNDFIQYPELERFGIAKVTGYNKSLILKTLEDIKNKRGLYQTAKNSKFMLGDFKSTKRIVEFLERLS